MKIVVFCFASLLSFVFNCVFLSVVGEHFAVEIRVSAKKGSFESLPTQKKRHQTESKIIRFYYRFRRDKPVDANMYSKLYAFASLPLLFGIVVSQPSMALSVAIASTQSPATAKKKGVRPYASLVLMIRLL